MAERVDHQDTTLVVLANHIPNMVAWTLDWAIQQREAGRQVALLDAGWQASRYAGRRSRVLVDNYSHKGGINATIRSVCKDHNIEYLGTAWPSFEAGDQTIRPEDTELFTTCVRSTYARYFGSAEIALEDLEENTLRDERRAFNSTLRLVQSTLDAHPDIAQVVTTNGRFVVDTAIVHTARRHGASTLTLERSPSDLGKILEFRVATHSVSEWQRLIREFWALRPDSVDDVETISASHLEARVSGGWAWTANQLSGSEILRALGDSRYVAYFPTSDWEFSAFGDPVPEGRFASQVESFEAVCAEARNHGLDVVVRGHPQPGDARAAALEDALWWRRTAEHGAKYIPCNADASSVELAAKAVFSAVHESSIGVDLMWLGLPVVVLSKTSYSFLAPETEAQDREALAQYFTAPKSVQSREQLLPYGYFEAAAGMRLVAFRVYAHNSVKYRGTPFLADRTRLFTTRKVFHDTKAWLRKAILRPDWVEAGEGGVRFRKSDR